MLGPTSQLVHNFWVPTPLNVFVSEVHYGSSINLFLSLAQDNIIFVASCPGNTTNHFGPPCSDVFFHVNPSVFMVSNTLLGGSVFCYFSALVAVFSVF